ncbi:unnamed protein product [Fraxinus pennsylvanica]|uniref:non-specific serine/threonine protein kinase n=1 Tax=Fraxinus pennsylvanica TaxID=56036 RepID=A0AAD2AJ61_9LAMI|nr:unnamed protein product [Fraxinus pennsylvanica]
MGTCWPKPVDSLPTTISSSPAHNDAKLIKNRNRHNSNSNSNSNIYENGGLSAADPNRGGKGGRGGSDHQGVPPSESTSERNSVGARGIDNNGQKINVTRTFTFEELAMATQKFRESNLIGKGGFGSVYKGFLDSDMVVAVKQLNLEGLQGNQEFIVEVFMLSLLHHPNLVNLIGYCAHGEQRFLVYEYMPLGSLDRLLFDLEPDQKPLNWSTRLKIALDVIDHNRKPEEKNLIMWFLPFLKDHKKFVQMADPLLERRFSVRSLHHAVTITAMCLQEQPSFRPAISDIVTALEYVAS